MSHPAGGYAGDLTVEQWGWLAGLLPNYKLSRPIKIDLRADGVYRGKLVDQVKGTFEVVLNVVLRPDDQVGFVVLPKRWIVDRTVARFGRYWRLSKDCEQRLENSEGMVYLAPIHQLHKRLTPAL